MKKIIVFTAYYEPEIASSLYLCQNLYNDLSHKNIQIEIYTPLPTRGVTDETRKYYKKHKYEKKDNITIHRVTLMKEYKNKILRLIRYVIMNSIFIYKSLFISADAIFVQSTPPTQGVMGAIIKKIRRIPFIYNLQDVFPDSMVLMGMINEKSIIYKIGRKLENFTYRHADKIIVISSNIEKNLLQKGVPSNKIEVVSNWVDTDIIKPIEKKDNFLYEKYELNKDYFYIIYAGNLGYAQNIDVILEAAALLTEYKTIKFLIFGTGVLENEHKEKAKKMNLKNVTFLPFQAYKDVSNVYSLADASIISCQKGFGGSAMPSKTWNIMATQTPILASFDENTDMEKMIFKYKVGLFSQSGDAEALSNNIIMLFTNEKLRYDYGINAKKYVDKYVSREVCINMYYEIFLDILNKN